MSDWAERATGALREAGHRRGQAREAVIALFDDEGCALSARQIDDRLRQGGATVGLASVYRTLELLVELRLLARVELGSTTLFERLVPGGEHHHHLVCSRCGDLVPFDDTELERTMDSLAERLPFTVEQHDIVLHGKCERCS